MYLGFARYKKQRFEWVYLFIVSIEIKRKKYIYINNKFYFVTYSKFKSNWEAKGELENKLGVFLNIYWNRLKIDSLAHFFCC